MFDKLTFDLSVALYKYGILCLHIQDFRLLGRMYFYYSSLQYYAFVRHKATLMYAAK